MQCLEARLKSYDAVTRPKRAAKVAFPLDPEQYPHLTPAALSKAGFYHQPGKEKDVDSHDTCKCFMCGLVLGGWDEDDDPFAEHVRRDGECAWKEVICRIEVDRLNGGEGRLRKVYESADLLPNSDRMRRYREDTFKNWWPHSKPTAQDLAAAGFVYTPGLKAPDATTCPLCQYEVVEWEENDNPWDIHHRKEPDCPFFTATVEVTKSKGRKAAGRTTRRTTAATAASESDAEPAPPKRRGRQTKTSTLAASTSTVATEDEVAPPKRRGRPPKASVVEEPAEPEPPAPPKRRGRQTKNSSASELASSTSTRRATSTRSRSKASTANEVVEDHDDSLELPQPEPEEPEEPAPKPSKSSRAKGKKKAEPEPEPEPEVEQPEVAQPVDPEPVPEPVAEPQPQPAAEPAPEPEPEVAEPAPPSPEKPKRKTKPLPRKKVSAATEPVRDREAPAASTKSVPNRPLAQADANIPTPPPPAPKASSPSVRHAVDAIVGKESKHPPLTEEQKNMTLEDYVRLQFKLRHEEMRREGESMIAAWEARTRDARAKIETA